MKLNNYSISNHTEFYRSYMDVIGMHYRLMTDEHMHWCKENEELEKLRANAYEAVEAYMHAMASIYHNEEKELTEQLLKKKTLF